MASSSKISEREVIEYAKKSLLDELYSAAIYVRLAKIFKRKKTIERFKKMAKMEARHAEFWIEFLKRRNINVENIKTNTITVMFKTILYRILGEALTLKLMELGEREAITVYSILLESPYLSSDEKDKLKKILEDELLHEQEIMEEEEVFKEFTEHIRDAVLGMSDGLVEVLSVAAGLAGAYGNPLNVAIGGTIVGIAGALSMGIGAFTSVRAQRQVRMGVLYRVRLMAKHVYHLLRNRIVEYMVRKGFSKHIAEKVAEESLKNRELLEKIIAEEEYGLREERLENPGKAGFYTGAFYILGALVPLTPYYMGFSIPLALPVSFIIAAVMLGFMGFVIAVLAEISIKRKVLELILSGLGSATLTFLIGKLASWIFGIEVE